MTQQGNEPKESAGGETVLAETVFLGETKQVLRDKNGDYFTLHFGRAGHTWGPQPTENLDAALAWFAASVKENEEAGYYGGVTKETPGEEVGEEIGDRVFEMDHPYFRGLDLSTEEGQNEAVRRSLDHLNDIFRK